MFYNIFICIFGQNNKIMSELEYSNIIDIYEKPLLRFILSRTNDIDLSKDISQDAILKLWLNKTSVKIESAKSWLFTTAYNNMINIIKYNKRIVKFDNLNEIITNSSTIEEEFDTKDFILKEFKKLTQQERRLITLRDIHKMSYDEIGQKLKLTESQVKVYLFRTRKKLKDKLKEIK